MGCCAIGDGDERVMQQVHIQSPQSPSNAQSTTNATPSHKSPKAGAPPKIQTSQENIPRVTGNFIVVKKSQGAPKGHAKGPSPVANQVTTPVAAMGNSWPNRSPGMPVTTMDVFRIATQPTKDQLKGCLVSKKDMTTELFSGAIFSDQFWYLVDNDSAKHNSKRYSRIKHFDSGKCLATDAEGELFVKDENVNDDSQYWLKTSINKPSHMHCHRLKNFKHKSYMYWHLDADGDDWGGTRTEGPHPDQYFKYI